MSAIDIESSVTGTVWKIEATAGASLKVGDVVMIIESMKMEIPIEAEDDGVLSEILVAEGEAVSEDQVLARLSPA